MSAHIIRRQESGDENLAPKNRVRYFKVFNRDLKHHGFKYKANALNVDTKRYLAGTECIRGLHFFTEKQLFAENFWMFFEAEEGAMYAEITIPDNAQVDFFEGKCKADRIFVHDLVDAWSCPRFCLNSVRHNGRAMRFAKVRDPYVCRVAVKNDGCALSFMTAEEQTPEVCMFAVKQNGYALQFVEIQTPELCMAAVKQSGFALQFVEEQTLELCLIAVLRNGLALEYVKEQTPDICETAVNRNPAAWQFVKKRDNYAMLYFNPRHCGY